jgi:hypothetical protein
MILAGSQLAAWQIDLSCCGFRRGNQYHILSDNVRPFASGAIYADS